MVSSFVIRVVSYGHEVGQLSSKPIIEVLRVGSDQVSADENVEYASDERNFLSKGDGFRIVPPRPKSID